MTNIFIVFVLLLGLPAGKQTLTNNEYVSIKLISPHHFSDTDSGTLAFFFSPAEGIHVNSVPPFEIQLENDSPFEIIGKPKFQKDDKAYLETIKPVEFLVKVKQGIQPGKYLLKGNLNYFFCSDKEGWCNRFTQPIEVNIEISK